MRILSILLVIAMFGVLGCTQQASENGTEGQAAQTEEQAPAETEAVAALAFSVGDDVSLAGVAGCGHCDFQKGGSCAMAMQVADGTIFILDGIDEDTEAFNQRSKGLDITVVGKVTDVGDPHHLAVESYDM